ncbi:MAG: hypothetical protein KC636_39375, partial [Myxococcales bacterium]|nr:hypothetical protein [Myxococcales bacterium]
MRRNRLKERLARGDVALGTLVWDTRTRGAIFTLAAAGMDFVVICMEHSTYSLETVAELVSYAHAAGITPVVRVPSIDAASVTRLLDCGCQSLIAPRVESAEEVARLIRLAKYHPEGERGAAIQAYANTDYEDVEPAAAMRHANDNTLLGVIVERRGAVEQLDAILAHPLELVIVGKQDLAQSYGVPGQWTPALSEISAR